MQIYNRDITGTNPIVLSEDSDIKIYLDGRTLLQLNKFIPTPLIWVVKGVFIYLNQRTMMYELY
jgi:hypothetical protein